MQTVIATILAWFGGSVVAKLKACIPELVAAAQRVMADGTITAAERKAFVMEAIDIISAKWGYKLTGILRWAISKIVDAIAKKLPSNDVNVSAVVNTTLKEWTENA